MSDGLSLQMLAVELTNLDFQVNENFALDGGGEVAPLLSMRYHFRDELTQEGRAETLNQWVTANVLFHGKDGAVLGEASRPFRLSVAVRGRFRMAADASPKRREALLVGASALLFPFIREIIANVTQRSPFPALLIPPTNIVELRSQALKAQTQASERVT